MNKFWISNINVFTYKFNNNLPKKYKITRQTNSAPIIESSTRPLNNSDNNFFTSDFFIILYAVLENL